MTRIEVELMFWYETLLTEPGTIQKDDRKQVTHDQWKLGISLKKITAFKNITLLSGYRCDFSERSLADDSEGRHSDGVLREGTEVSHYVGLIG